MEGIKNKESKIIPILVVGIVILLLTVVYFVTKQPVIDTDNTISPSVTGLNGDQPQTIESASGSQVIEQETAEETEPVAAEEELYVDHSDDIEEDLELLDSLDLSTQENDLGDDKLSDL